MRLLAEAGMTTREACGNSVRNITACPYAGISADELFDVTPYAEALTGSCCGIALSSTLPRKFKIAFEGCPDDHTAMAINDLGVQARSSARRRARLPGDRRRRHRADVQVGRRRSTSSSPATELFRVGEALLIVFKEHGDYEHQQRNRMKFMIKKLGWDRFVAGVSEARSPGAAARARCRCSTIDAAEHGNAAGLGSRRGADAELDRRRACRRGAADRAGHHADALPVFIAGDEAYKRWRADQRPPAEAVRVRDRDRHRAARRSDERADARARRTGRGLQRRHHPRHGGSESGLAMGPDR